MGLEARDIYLIAPELGIAVLGMLIVFLDLAVGRRKDLLLVFALAGLLVPTAFGILLWEDIDGLQAGADEAFHGTVVLDKFALFFKFLIIAILALLLLASREYISRFRRHQAEFIGLVFLSAAGLMTLASAADLITVYIALELAALPVVALAAFPGSEVRSIEAGIKFLLLSAISSAVLLYGFAYIYGATGTVRIFSLDSAVPTIATMVTATDSTIPFGSYALLVGVVLTVAGLGFKLSIVPFQMWTPDVYEGAPTPVGAFLAVASKAAGFAILLRLFHVGLGAVSDDWTLLFAILSAVTMTVGNVVAIAQSNLKRLLGYSAIAHAGYMLIGVAAVAETGSENIGPSGLMFYLVAYGAMNLTAFFAIMAITSRTGNEQIDGLAGMAKRSPWLAGLLAFSLLSLMGVPPTAGFMGKLFLFNAAVDADLVWLAVMGTVNSVVSAYYYVRIIRVMYLPEAPSTERLGISIPASMALAVTGVGILFLGIMPNALLDVARTAARSLIP